MESENGGSWVAADGSSVESVVAVTANGTLDHMNETFMCRQNIPTASQLLTTIPHWYMVLLGFYGLCCLFNFVLYLEEIHFITKHFRRGSRQKKTLWILTFFPVFAIVSFLAVLVPRSGTLCDLVSNVFFVTCLYQFVGLMENYIGDKDNLHRILAESREISINTPPCCCCCFCLPKLKLHGRRYMRLSWLVAQIIIVRPLLMFTAAVLWTNGSYIPGNLAPTNGFLYISTLNLLATLLAMWGLMVLKTALSPDLEEKFSLTGKIGCIQLCLLSSSIPNIIIGILVTANVIHCTSFYPSKARADAIYHGIVVVLMPIYGLMARRFFRRKEDADGMVADGKDGLLHIHLDSFKAPPVDQAPTSLLNGSDGVSNA